MKRKMITCVAMLLCFIMIGCRASTEIEVTKYATLSDEMKKLESEMQQDGYQLYNAKKMGDDRKQEIYTFRNDSSESVEFTISYDLNEYEDIIYIEDINVGCNVSVGSLYSKYCGDEATIQNVQNLPKDATVRKFSVGKLVRNLIVVDGLIGLGIYVMYSLGMAALSR